MENVQQLFLQHFMPGRQLLLGHSRMIASIPGSPFLLSQRKRICLGRLTLYLLIFLPFMARIERLHSTGDINVQQHVKLRGQPPAQSFSTMLKCMQ